LIQPSILIVENESVVAEDLTLKVKALGYRVVGLASQGETALELAQEQHPDLILLDIKLEGTLDGIETAYRLRDICDLPFLFITAHSDPETVKRASAAGASGYILKPFREQDLEVQLRAAMYMSDRKRTEQKLRKTEDLLLRAQRGAHAGVWEIDLRRDRITWSEPYYDLFGIDHSTEPSVAIWLSSIHPEDREHVLAAYRRSLKDKSNQNMEFRIVKPDGAIRWILRQGQVEIDERGTAIRIQGISFDITDRKQADDVVKAIALFPAQNPSPVLRISRAGILLYMNPVSDQLLHDLHLRVGQPVPYVLETLAVGALKASASQQAEYALGSCHYLITVTPVAEGDYANFYWTDITERKRVEVALSENEERLRLAMQAGQMGAWGVDLETGTVTWDAKQHELFGQPMDKAPKTLEEFYALLHPDDVERTKHAVAATERTGTFSTDFRILRPDGQIRWLVGQGAIVPQQAGYFLQIVGVNYDVTERKEAQFRLERFNEELERQVSARTYELVDSEGRLRALATELNLAEQRERTRLANDLHDYLAQLLVLGRITLSQTKRLELPSRVEKLIKETEGILDKALNYCRTLMTELNPPVLQDQGISAGLLWLGEYMKRQELEVTVKIDSASSLMLPHDRAVLVFQSVRELLMNVAKHGAVKEAVVTMTYEDGWLTIEVRDENGFDVRSGTNTSTISPLSSKFGLFSIRERMKAVGGTFAIASWPGKGTIATISLPHMPPVPTS